MVRSCKNYPVYQFRTEPCPTVLPCIQAVNTNVNDWVRRRVTFRQPEAKNSAEVVAGSAFDPDEIDFLHR